MPQRRDRRATSLRELTRAAGAAYVDAQEVMSPALGRQAVRRQARSRVEIERKRQEQTSAEIERKRQELASASVRS